MTALRFLLCEKVSVHVGLLPCSTAHSNLSRGSVCHTLPSPHCTLEGPLSPPTLSVTKKNSTKIHKIYRLRRTSLPSRYLNFLLPYSPPSPSLQLTVYLFIYFSLFLTQGRAQSLVLYPRLLITHTPDPRKQQDDDRNNNDDEEHDVLGQ
jgi:hypothetical protein